jgi:hypothetical protein
MTRAILTTTMRTRRKRRKWTSSRWSPAARRFGSQKIVTVVVLQYLSTIYSSKPCNEL